MWGDSGVNFENAHNAFGAETFNKGIKRNTKQPLNIYKQSRAQNGSKWWCGGLL